MAIKKPYILVGSLGAVLALGGCAKTPPVQPVEEKTPAIIQTEIELFCSTDAYNLNQVLTISNVTGIANHRDGRLLIVEPIDSPDLTSELLKLAKMKNVSVNCMEYLSTNDLLGLKDGDNLMARVYFNFDSNKLTRESRIILGKVANKLGFYPNTVDITGYTDWQGSDEYNYGLGLRRADSVGEFLTTPETPDDKLKIRSKGEADPMATNETKAGRKLNRRVELRLAPVEFSKSTGVSIK